MSNQLKCQVLADDFPSFDLSFKIIIVGDSGVGKSCLSIKASRNYFEDFYSPTVGFEFLTFNVKVEDQNIKLQIWDTCGQEVYRSLISSFYRNASLAMIVYSIDSKDSFLHLDAWLKDVKLLSSPDVKVFLIGNKADLEYNREVSKDEAKKYANEHGFNYYNETFAKSGFNAKEVFIQAAKVLYLEHLKFKNRGINSGNQNVNNRNNNIPMRINKENIPERKKGGCC
jgi:small GTP-binding protein